MLGPILFLLYIIDFFNCNNIIDRFYLLMIPASVSNPNLVNFKNYLIFSFEQLNAWFNTNLLSLNYNKTQYVQFRTTNSLPIQIDIIYKNKYIGNDTNTLFFGYHYGQLLFLDESY
jgi:hypothetical protein